jgi:hypothetical protein
MKKEYDLDTSWLHDKYNFGNNLRGEINTKLPYVAVDGEVEFFVQGEDADVVIGEIHTIWLSDGRRTEKSAFLKWINLYL